MKSRAAIKALLLPAMQACPEGASMLDYAKRIGYSRAECSKAGADLLALGLIGWCQDGMHKVWTVAEHVPALQDRCEADQAVRQAARDERRRLDDRRRRRTEEHRRRERMRSRPDRKARYPWPQVSVYTEPKPIRSVWDLACR
jgi:hypothetical protein